MATHAFDFTALLKNIPRGAWVAISADKTHVIAFSAEMKDVLEEAQRRGESTPIIVRIPESEVSLML